MFSKFTNWITSWGSGLSTGKGQQITAPQQVIFDHLENVGTDRALQIAAVFACVELYANTIASLPIFVYRDKADGHREEERKHPLWTLLHKRPNAWMTPSDFKATLVVNYVLRGNAYVLIHWNKNGQPIALEPLPAEQVTVSMVDGELVYKFHQDGKDTYYQAKDIVHWKGAGSGIVGLSKIDYMRASLSESVNAQMNATRLFGARSKPSAVLQTDMVLSADQTKEVVKRFKSMVESGGSLVIADRGLKYTPMSLTPQDAQLLESRQFSVEEICRWFGVPPVMIGGSGTTTWGSGITEIKRGFHSLSLAPMCKRLEEAFALKLVKAEEDLTIEFNYDALLRADPQTRAQHEATLVQNGIMTRNEVRQLENLPPMPGGDVLTVQSNLVAIDKVSQIGEGSNTQGSNDGSTIKQ